MPVTFKHRQPMRGVIFAGIALVGVAALAPSREQRVHERQPRHRPDVRRLRRRPAAVPDLRRPAGARPADRDGARRPHRQERARQRHARASRPRSCSPTSASAMIAARRSSPTPLQAITNFELIGTIVRGGRHAARRVRRGDGGVRRRRCSGRPSCGAGSCPSMHRCRSCCSRSAAPCSPPVPLLIAGFLDQVGGDAGQRRPGGGDARPRLRQLGPSCGTAVAGRSRPDGARRAGVRRADAQGLHRCR